MGKQTKHKGNNANYEGAQKLQNEGKKIKRSDMLSESDYYRLAYDINFESYEKYKQRFDNENDDNEFELDSDDEQVLEQHRQRLQELELRNITTSSDIKEDTHRSKKNKKTNEVSRTNKDAQLQEKYQQWLDSPEYPYIVARHNRQKENILLDQQRRSMDHILVANAMDKVQEKDYPLLTYVMSIAINNPETFAFALFGNFNFLQPLIKTKRQRDMFHYVYRHLKSNVKLNIDEIKSIIGHNGDTQQNTQLNGNNGEYTNTEDLHSVEITVLVFILLTYCIIHTLVNNVGITENGIGYKRSYRHEITEILKQKLRSHFVSSLNGSHGEATETDDFNEEIDEEDVVQEVVAVLVDTNIIVVEATIVVEPMRITLTTKNTTIILPVNENTMANMEYIDGIDMHVWNTCIVNYDFSLSDTQRHENIQGHLVQFFLIQVSGNAETILERVLGGYINEREQSVVIYNLLKRILVFFIEVDYETTFNNIIQFIDEYYYMWIFTTPYRYMCSVCELAGLYPQAQYMIPRYEGMLSYEGVIDSSHAVPYAYIDPNNDEDNIDLIMNPEPIEPMNPNSENFNYEDDPDYFDSLNGANGEYTGDDDLALNIDNAKQQAKINNKNKHTKNPNIGKFNKNKKSSNELDEEPKIMDEYKLYNTFHDNNLIGCNIKKLDMNVSEYAELVNAGTRLTGITEYGYGWAVTGTSKHKHNNVCIQNNFILLEGKYVSEVHLQYLKNKCSTKLLNETSLEAIRLNFMGIIPGVHDGIMHEIALNTFNYYVNNFIKIKTRMHADIRLANGEMLATDNPTCRIVADVMLYVIEKDVMWLQYPEKCMIDCNYPLRKRMIRSIIYKNDETNTSIQYNRDTPDMLNTEWQFKDLDNGEKTFKRTMFFKITGVNHFITYPNSGRTMNSALKRIVGARDDEDEYVQNQLYILQLLRRPTRLDHNDESTLIYFLKKASNILIRRSLRYRLGALVDQALYIKGVCYQWVQDIYDNHLLHCIPRYHREISANVPHAKKQQRIGFYNQVLYYPSGVVLIKQVIAQVKMELAKPSKAGRLFVAYSREWVNCPVLAELGKCALSEPFVIYLKKYKLNIWILSIGQDLQTVFDKLLEAIKIPNYLLVIVYSDDSVYAGNINGHVILENVDISSCDSSNAELMFYIVKELLQNINEEYADSVIQGCFQPIVIRNGIENITINLNRPFEGSGTTLTTLINHVASYTIASSVFFHLTQGHLFKDALKIGGKSVGHQLTSESCTQDGSVIFEKVQFLKYSPIQTITGKYIPVRNFGCILRGLGSLYGDLDSTHFNISTREFKTLSNTQRMDAYTGVVVNSYCNEPHSELLDILRLRFPLVSNLRITEEKIEKITAHIYRNDINYNTETLDQVSLNKRYPGYIAQIAELCNAIGDLKIGHEITSNLVGMFFHIDYGLTLSPLQTINATDSL